MDPNINSDETSLYSESVAISNASKTKNSEEEVNSTLDSTNIGSEKLSLSILDHPVGGGILRKRLLHLENSRDMILRWEMDSLDLKTVVEDALNSDRIPLAVLQLHLQHQREMATKEKARDSFEEVCRVGRAIAYGLFLKVVSFLCKFLS